MSTAHLCGGPTVISHPLSPLMYLILSQGYEVKEVVGLGWTPGHSQGDLGRRVKEVVRLGWVKSLSQGDLGLWVLKVQNSEAMLRGLEASAHFLQDLSKAQAEFASESGSESESESGTLRLTKLVPLCRKPKPQICVCSGESGSFVRPQVLKYNAITTINCKKLKECIPILHAGRLWARQRAMQQARDAAVHRAKANGLFGHKLTNHPADLRLRDQAT